MMANRALITKQIIDFSIDICSIKCILKIITIKLTKNLKGLGIKILDRYTKREINIIYLVLSFLSIFKFNNVVNSKTLIKDSIKPIGKTIIFVNNSFSVVRAVQIV